MVTLPALDGVEHKFVDVGGGATIHVADAGPADGPPVMLVHGFPENWWEWHELVGPLAADGYRVLCPDLRGAGPAARLPQQLTAIPEQRDRGMHGGLDDLAHAASVLDGEGGQLTQAAHQDHRQWPRQRR